MRSASPGSAPSSPPPVRKPTVSIVVCAHNMARELPRTIRSLSPVMQRGVQRSDYEVIVVDNGSTQHVDHDACGQWGVDLRVLPIPSASASPSPVRALNSGIAQARGELVGVLIDGARIVSPGVVSSAVSAAGLAERAVILTLGFHLGTQVQMESVRQGYDQQHEDRLLARAGWTEDGYRLFDVSVFAGSCRGGWFSPMTETNAIFMGRELWEELRGFDERFQAPGGGFANLDMLARAVELPGVVVVTLLGEGTFHQVHGGVATNSVNGDAGAFDAEYRQIRGHAFRPPVYESLYFGSVPEHALASIASAAQMALLRSRGANVAKRDASVRTPSRLRRLRQATRGRLAG